MNDDLNSSLDNSAEPPKNTPAANPSQDKVNQGDDPKSGSNPPQNTNNHKPRIKGSHRSGKPPKLKWL